jgi:hypothetical protein
MWVADDFNRSFQGVLGISQLLAEGIPFLVDYMGFGGNVLLTGWEGAKGLQPLSEYPFDPEPGDFLYDYFGIDAISYKRESDFSGALGQSFFSDLALEPTRLRGNWGGELIRIEYITELRPDANVGFLFDSDDPDSGYHHQPCATYRDGGGFRTVYLGFPLYHFDTGDAQTMIEAAMTYFGELPSTEVSDLDSQVVALALAQNRPNPFRGVTDIVFAVPREGGVVELTIYDLAGRRVRSLVRGKIPGGVYREKWYGLNDSGRRVSSGVYFYRLKGENRKLTKKMLLFR